MEPQKPPKEALTPEGQNRRQPTARTARPISRGEFRLLSNLEEDFTCHECNPEPEAPKDPSRYREWAQKVRAEVCCGESRGFASSDIEVFLEMGVENVE
jgi:hypothetical protein